jgi:hypothetical protein
MKRSFQVLASASAVVLADDGIVHHEMYVGHPLWEVRIPAAQPDHHSRLVEVEELQKEKAYLPFVQ